MRRFILALLTAVGIMLSGCTQALPVQNGGSTVGVGISVSGAWARPAQEGNGAAYMILSNIGGQADRLVGVSGDVAGALELHTVENNNGVMAMRPVEGIDIPAGGQVELKPGSFHVMMIGLNGELKAGDRIPLTLRFQNAGEVDVMADVRNQ
ncbi:MAG: hypothetical protein RLZZ387_3485 [Chloroflexota bacterium]|jgi:copper(I)-binding protein